MPFGTIHHDEIGRLLRQIGDAGSPMDHQLPESHEIEAVTRQKTDSWRQA
jgi:hypothetical protein